jgi:hypothetical protein
MRSRPKENLARTLGHERTHVMQYKHKLYSTASSAEQQKAWEQATYNSEEQFSNFNGGLG